MKAVLHSKKYTYWIYILLCENSHYYTGYTNNLEKRFAAHLKGTASKYTRSFKPICIAQSWMINGEKSLAMKIEKFIKNLNRVKKEKIIADPDLLMNFLQEITKEIFVTHTRANS